MRNQLIAPFNLHSLAASVAWIYPEKNDPFRSHGSSRAR